MKWKQPPITKIYEALGTVADERVHVLSDGAKVYSSTGNKFYNVSYNSAEKAIMTNDNGSYWKGYLGYPAIAFLMKSGVISYDKNIASLLKNIVWKDINKKFKNDFEKALDYILSTKSTKEKELLREFTEKVYKEIKILSLNKLGKKVLPPEGY